jgi:hypothetical protein
MLGETGDYTFCRQWLMESVITLFSVRRSLSHYDILFSGLGVHRSFRELVLDWVKEGSWYRPLNFKATTIFPWKLIHLPLYEPTRLGLVCFIGGPLGCF